MEHGRMSLEDAEGLSEPLVKTRLLGKISHCLPVYRDYLSRELTGISKTPRGKGPLWLPYETGLGRLGGIYPLGLLLGKIGKDMPDGLRLETWKTNHGWAKMLRDILNRRDGWEINEAHFCWQFGGYGWLPDKKVTSPTSINGFRALVAEIERRGEKDRQGWAVYNRRRLFPEGLRRNYGGRNRDRGLEKGKEQEREMAMAMGGSKKWREQTMEMQSVPLMNPGPTMRC